MARINERFMTVIISCMIFSTMGLMIPEIIPTAKATTFFSEDFEPNPLPGWTTTGYWHLVNDSSDPCIGAPHHPNNSYSPGHSFAYHIESTCDYDDGTQNSGNLTSPPIDLSGASRAYLHIQMWFQTEWGDETDVKYVQISPDGSSWIDLGLIAANLGDPMGVWFEKDYNISLYAGDPDVWIRFGFDNVIPSVDYFAGWYIDDILIDDSPISPDILLVEPWNIAPRSVDIGFGPVPMLQLNLSTNKGSITVTSIKIELSGLSPNPSNVFKAKLYSDSNNNGFFEFGPDTLLDEKNPPFPITFSTDIDVNPSRPTRLFILYTLNPPLEEWVGVSIPDSSYITVSKDDIVSSANFPMDTFIKDETTQIVDMSWEELTVEGWIRAPNTVEPGEADILFLQLNLTANENIIRAFSIFIAYSGSPVNPSNFDECNLWLDVDYNDIFDPERDQILPSGTSIWVTPEKPVKLFGVCTIDPGANIGDWIGIRISTISAGGTATISSSGFPIDTYIPGVATQIVAPSIDTLEVVSWESKNPPKVEQGTQDVLMANFTVAASANSVTMGLIDVDLKGTFSSPEDVIFVKLYHDADDNGLLDTGIDERCSRNHFINGSPPNVGLGFSGSGFKVVAGTPESFLIAYDISRAAEVGAFIGLTLVNETYVDLHVWSSDIVASLNFPIETNPDTEIVVLNSDQLRIDYWQANNPLEVFRGTLAMPMVNMTLEVDTNSVTISAIELDLKGTPTSAADVSSIRIFHDVNGNGILDGNSDILLGFGAFSGLAPPKAIVFLGIFGFTVMNTSAESILIVFNISPIANAGDFVGISILDETYFRLPAWSLDTVSSMNFPIETPTDTEIVYPKGNLIGHVEDVNSDSIIGASAVLHNSSGHVMTSALTNETGWFTLNKVNQTGENLTIVVSKEYYGPEVLDGIFVVQDMTIELGPFTLQTNATIHGRIIAEEGASLENATVELLNEHNKVVLTVYTDSSGEYVFTGVEYGNYAIRANATGYEDYTTAEIYSIDKDNLNLTIPDISLMAEPPDDGDSGIWLWIIIVVVIIIILVLVYFLVKKKGRKPESEEPEEDQDAGEPPENPD
jgi:hypothetical protein